MLRRGLLTAVAAVTAVGVAVLLFQREHEPAPPTPPSYAELVAKNYRVLTSAQSRTLVEYAQSIHRCIAGHGARYVAAPVASPTRITMHAPGRTARALLQLLTACDAPVGPPPARSTLQARQGAILVYLPKRCLLDPRRLAHTSRAGV
jgi:hypothetical protein